MKKKNKFFYPLCVLLLLGYCFFTACQDEWIADKQPDVPTPSSPLEQARQWYNDVKQGEEVLLTPSTRSGPPQLFYTEPSWNWYKISYKDHLTVIDVDLTDRIGLDFTLRENLDEYEKTGEFKYKHSITRLVIVMDNTTGEKEGFLMTIIPTIRYARYFSYRMHLSTYLKRDGHLEGLVVFHDLNGKFVNGWKYEGGRAWWTLTESDAETENSISYSTLSASYRIISEPTTRYNSEDYYAGELPEVIITAPGPGGGDNGGGIWLPIPNPNPGDGGYGGGGSGGGSNTNPPTGENSNKGILDKLYNSKSNLTAADKQKLASAISELQNNPILDKMLKDLAEMNVSFTFKYDNSTLLAYFSKASGSIAFNGSGAITASALREEFVHAMQYYGVYGDQMVTSKTNFEFEAKMFQDIACIIGGGACPYIGIVGMMNNQSYVSLYNEILTDFIDNPNTKFNFEHENKYYQLGQQWDQYSGTFDKNIGPELLKKYFK